MRNFKEQSNWYIGLSQAAILLGYKDYRKIEELIDKGFLSAYQLPAFSKVKVRYHELMAVPFLIKQSANR